MKELYIDLSRPNENGQLKAVALYGVRIGAGVLAFLYTETHTLKTKKFLKMLDIVTNLSPKEFGQVYDIVKDLESEDL